MKKVARSFSLVCVVAVGVGLLPLAFGMLAGSIASAAAIDTIAVITGSGIPFMHLLAAGAVLALCVTALRMVGELESTKRLRERPLHVPDAGFHNRSSR
jgi:hypothetical protein